jgi:hypothetical protein
MKHFFFMAILLTIIVMGCQPAGKPLQAENEKDGKAQEGGDYIIIPGKRIGPFTSEHALENDLVQTFGVNNIKKQSIYVAEGEEIPGYIVFPDTKDEIQIAYDTAVAKDKPAFIRIDQEGSHWKTNNGITIGTSLEELVKINGKDFDFFGFDWDYGGSVTDWKNGKLTNDLQVGLGYDSNNLPNELMGDRTISSNHPKVKGQKIKVAMFSFSL